jgi:hypothetical protein
MRFRLVGQIKPALDDNRAWTSGCTTLLCSINIALSRFQEPLDRYAALGVGRGSPITAWSPVRARHSSRSSIGIRRA